MLEPSPVDWVTVRTTLPALPFAPGATRPEVRTERLVLRQTSPDDLQAFHELRLQPAVMQWTMQGVPDKDLDHTRGELAKRLPPNDEATFQYTICEADTGAAVGFGGHFRMQGELGWPIFGYMFRQEAWGKGYATEFLRAFLDAYWAQPRVEAEVKVDRKTVELLGTDTEGVVAECVMGVTVPHNRASQNVMSKSGCVLAKVWEDVDVHDESRMETLYAFVSRAPSTAS